MSVHIGMNENIKTILEQGKTCNIRAFCQIFINLFDIIYINKIKHPLVSYILWIWIFVTWGFVLYFDIGTRLLGGYVETTLILWVS